MGDPIPAPPTDHSHISNDLQESLASLAHKHVHVSYAIIGVLGLVLILCGIGAYFGEKSWEKAMDRAEAAEKEMVADRTQYQQVLAGYQKQLDINNAQIQADQLREADLLNQIKNRDAQANANIGNVLKPGKTAQDAYADLVAAYKDIKGPDGHPPVLSLNVSKDPVSGEQLLTFGVPAVQTFSATALAQKRDSADLSQTKEALGVEQHKNSLLADNLLGAQNSLTALQKTETQCELTVEAYKKVAKKSRFKKILAGAEKVAIFVGGVYLGHKF